MAAATDRILGVSGTMILSGCFKHQSLRCAKGCQE